jgi:hypothetical protein
MHMMVDGSAKRVVRQAGSLGTALCPALDSQELHADGCGLRPGAFDGMGCTGLQSLSVSGNAGLSSLNGLAAVCGPSLRKLDASGCGLGHGFLALAGCTGLQELVVEDNHRLASLEGLGPSLRKLDASGCGLGWGALGALAGCSELLELEAWGNPRLGTLEGVGELGSLTALGVGVCGLRDLSPLGPGLARLARLDLRGNPDGAGLLPPALARLPALQEAVVDEGVPPPEGWVVHASSYGSCTLKRAAP